MRSSTRERGAQAPSESGIGDLAVIRYEETNATGIGHGVTARVLDAPAVAPAAFAVALRTLARILVRHHRQKGDCPPNANPETRSSSLTVVRSPSPHHGDESV